MSERYPGGLIRKTPPTVTGPTDGEGGSAPGIWTLEEVAYYEKEGGWPKPTLPRELYTWGSSSNGQLGQDNLIQYSSPVQVGSTEWEQISMFDISGAIKTDGSLWTWGGGSFGQLGHSDVINRSSPTQVGALTTWAQISAGISICAAIKTDGSLWTWGGGDGAADGGLGHNNVLNISSPVQVGALTSWSQVANGGRGLAAVKTDGTLWTWGQGFFGATGQNTTANISSPTQVGALTNWSAVKSGSGAFCAAIKTDGTLWTWGSGGSGQLGHNNAISLSSPVQVGALTTWAQAVPGNAFCAAIKTDGTLWTWGSGSVGRLGLNSITNTSSPIQVGALNTWSKLGTGNAHVSVIKTDGTLWTWGLNGNGQLGIGDKINRSSPVQVGAETTWFKNSGGTSFTAAITKG